jgi:hypothetical protein
MAFGLRLVRHFFLSFMQITAWHGLDADYSHSCVHMLDCSSYSSRLCMPLCTQNQQSET